MCFLKAFVDFLTLNNASSLFTGFMLRYRLESNFCSLFIVLLKPISAISLHEETFYSGIHDGIVQIFHIFYLRMKNIYMKDKVKSFSF